MRPIRGRALSAHPSGKYGTMLPLQGSGCWHNFCSNGHSSCVALKYGTRDARFPLPNPPPVRRGSERIATRVLRYWACFSFLYRFVKQHCLNIFLGRFEYV